MQTAKIEAIEGIARLQRRCTSISQITRKAYLTDLANIEWQHIWSMFPGGSPIGSPQEVDLREIVNAIAMGIEIKPV
jgi:hypothetical protein